MNRQYFEKVFSNERMQKFFDRYPGNETKAIVHYQINIELSEAFYPVLSIFEIALRNSLNRELTTHFGTDDWYIHMASTPGLKELNKEISNAKRHLSKRGETIAANKIVAELTLGFWVRLLNVEYERILWKSLRRAFPFMPKKERTRHNVSAPVNKIRNLRNRIFHHEPIAWNLNHLEQIHADIVKVIGWLNKGLPEVAKPLDRVTTVFSAAKEKLK
jgi:hypothetical protein